MDARNNPFLVDNSLFRESVGELSDLHPDDEDLEGQLVQLKERIQTAIDNNFKLGQFEVWWNNKSRKNRIYVVPEHELKDFSHNDFFLRRLLQYADFLREQDWALFHKIGRHNPLVHGKTTVELAWEHLCRCFNEDSIRENSWQNRSKWKLDDPTGPHRAP